MFAYEQSFLCLAYHCDIWHEAATYLYTQSKLLAQNEDAMDISLPSEAGNLYEKALNTFMRNNQLIYLAYAELEEVLMEFFSSTRKQ